MEFASWLKALGLFSLCAFIGTLIAVPLIIGHMRDDFFVTRGTRKKERRIHHPFLSLIIFFLRNGTGCILVIMGIIMLFLPGQGLLTIIIGLCLMDFPGKDRLIQRLTQNLRVQQVLNWIRRKRGKSDFYFIYDR